MSMQERQEEALETAERRARPDVSAHHPDTQDTANVIGKGPRTPTCGWSSHLCIFCPLARSGRKVIYLLGHGRVRTIFKPAYWGCKIKPDNPPGEKKRGGIFIAVAEVAGWVGWGLHLSRPQLIGKTVGECWFLRLTCSLCSSVGLKCSHSQPASRAVWLEHS